MTIDIQYQKMQESESLNEILTRKLEKLSKKYDWIIKAHVLFKLSNDKTGNDKICEIELSAPGPRLFAKSNLDNFEKAMAETIQDLDRQLQKRREQFKTY
nr:ribosome-associated translation inhibitor RaiA [Allomuricauda sp.]